MKYLLLSLIALTCCSCLKLFEESIPENCEGFDYIYVLEVPVSIYPHQIRYEVGDTIRIATHHSTLIYNLSAQQEHEIAGFPFRPISLLYKVDRETETHESGYVINGLAIDSIYHPEYFNSRYGVIGFRGRTRYARGQYRFEAELVLREAGKYVLLLEDRRVEYTSSTIEDPEQETIDSIMQASGLCTQRVLLVFNMVDSGDDYFDSFQQELIYLDEEVYSGKLEHSDSNRDFLGTGSLRVERAGCFAFEVVE